MLTNKYFSIIIVEFVIQHIVSANFDIIIPAMPYDIHYDA